MIRKNNKEVVSVIKGGKNVIKIYKGTNQVFTTEVKEPGGDSGYNGYEARFKFSGKFVEGSTTEDWWYKTGEDQQASLISYVDPFTMIFDTDSILINQNSEYTWHNNKSIEYLYSVYWSRYSSYMCYGCVNLKEVRIKTESTPGFYVSHTFNGCENLEKITFKEDLYILECGEGTTFEGCTSLSKIRTEETLTRHITSDIYLQDCPLDSESVDLIISALYQGSYTLYLSSFTYNNLTSTQKQQIKDLGWNVTT